MSTFMGPFHSVELWEAGGARLIVGLGRDLLQSRQNQD